jgi:hypothetical protein
MKLFPPRLTGRTIKIELRHLDWPIIFPYRNQRISMPTIWTKEKPSVLVQIWREGYRWLFQIAVSANPHSYLLLARISLRGALGLEKFPKVPLRQHR